ncbi:MAG: GntR family transcriptional regulator [Acidobacteriota bacterium]|nr:GntR family transcriptional regulator [Acidobacteriota bacterium]
MMQETLQRNGIIPLHAQIAEALRIQIQNDEFKEKENLPSERELAERYLVSRMTVRQALQKLRLEGLIYHERGVGTFVNNRKIDVHTRNLNGFSEEMLSLGLKPSSRVLTLQRELATDDVMENLRLGAGAEVVHLERLRLADGEAMAFEQTFLPAYLFPKLEEFDLMKNSLYQVLTENYDLEMHHAEEILEAKAANRFVAKQLGIRAGAPVLVVHRVVFSESNQPIESAHTTYRADRYRATFYLSKNT